MDQFFISWTNKWMEMSEKNQINASLRAVKSSKDAKVEGD